MSKKTKSKAGKAKAANTKPAPKKGAPVVARKPAGAAKAAVSATKVVAAKKTAPSVKPPIVAASAGKTPAKPQAKEPAARTIAASKPAAPKKTEGGAKRMAARAKTSEIVLPPGYRPSEDEPFMSELHRAYFRKRLLEWKEEILRQTRETLAILHEDSTQHADLADRATSETDRATELRTRDRQRKLIAKIDAAVSRIEDGTYGYCEETGEPIGLKRLDARPIATLSVEAQERHERREKVYREE